MWDWTRQRWGLPIPKEGWTRIGEQPKSDDDPDWRGVIKSKIREYPLPEPYNLKDFEDKPRYYWFDTPDYADPFKKLAWAAKFFLRTGLMTGCCVCILTGKKADIGGVLYMLNKWLIPHWFGGMGASVAIVTAANLRDKKDDMWNYALGGMAAGAIFGRRSILHYIRSNFFCIPAALAAKYMNENNLVILPQYNFNARNFGMTGFTADDGTWRTGDLRGGIKFYHYGDPGRDQRKTW